MANPRTAFSTALVSACALHASLLAQQEPPAVPTLLPPVAPLPAVQMQDTEPLAAEPVTPEVLGMLLADIVGAATPRVYEGEEDWEQQKRITSGLKFDGLKVSRRKKEVDHGTWKKYKITIDEREAPLLIRIRDLRSIKPGTVGLTLVVEGKLQGWAQVRRYNRGVHIITLTALGHSRVKATVDFTVALRPTGKGLLIDPQISDCQVDIQEFELTKFGEIRGGLAEELGDGMKRVLRRQIDSDKLTAKLNAAIAANQEKLTIDFTSAFSFLQLSR